MSRSDEKKLEELGIFGGFMHLLGVDWAGQLRQPDPPDPDVTITLTDSLLGIEITGIYDNSEGRPKEEGEQGELLARARRLYESKGHTSVTVGVIWDDRHKVVKRERPHLAQALMELVAQNVPSGNERRELDLRNQEELPLLSLSIHRTRPGGSGYWERLVRHFLEIRIFENFIQGPDQIVIGAVGLCPVGRDVARELGAEIIIVVA